jgi:hypothetical protein
MKKVISYIFVALLGIIYTGCGLNDKTTNIEKTPTGTETKGAQNLSTRSGVRFSVFAGKSGTKVHIAFLDPARSAVDRIEYNGRLISEEKIENEPFEYNASFPAYEKTHRFLIIWANGRQSSFETTVEPLDFQVEEPFTFYREKANELKLSRAYSGDRELWLGIFDRDIGAFKEIAEFNQAKTAIVVPASVSKRMSVGEAKITSYMVETKKIEDESFSGALEVSYYSECKLKVVK